VAEMTGRDMDASLTGGGLGPSQTPVE
jgi:hypothetical protein